MRRIFLIILYSESLISHLCGHSWGVVSSAKLVRHSQNHLKFKEIKFCIFLLGKHDVSRQTLNVALSDGKMERIFL